MAQKNYPLEIKDLDPKTNERLMKYFTGVRDGFIRIGPKGYLLPKTFEKFAADIYNMDVRPSDVFVVTYARSGTTWTQELVWLVVSDLDFERAKSITLVERFPFVESPMLIHPDLAKEVSETFNGDIEKLKSLELLIASVTDKLAAAPSPRFIKTHLPLSLLPPNVLDAKVVYSERSQRCCCFLLLFMQIFEKYGFRWRFQSILGYHDYWTPYFEHLKEAWKNRNHPNLLFIFYEEMLKDLKGVVGRVSEFFGKTYTDEQVAALCDHLDFKNFKNNTSVNSNSMKEIGLMNPKDQFIRQGKTGGWQDYFDEEMMAQAQKWMDDNLKDTDFRFPHLQ